MQHDEPVPEPLARLRMRAWQLHELTGIGKALYWDERVVMPPAASEGRADQRAWLSRREHELRTSSETREIVQAAIEWDAEHPEVVAMRRDLERSWAIPAELAARGTEVTVHAHLAWNEARVANDFAQFLPHLEALVEVAREESAAMDPTCSPYEAQLRRWEPGADAAAIADRLERLARRVAPIIRDARPVDSAILDRPIDDATKRAFERDLLGGLGFDWTRGRIDGTDRAFCVTVGTDDVRLTTRLHQRDGLRNLHSSMHEAGHGIYAQALQRLGLPAPVADIAGVGLDESQSRMFERFVGSSDALWSFWFPRLVDAAPDVFGAADRDALAAAFCAPEVDLLRIDCGEGAYDLHVLLRLRLERALLDGDLAARDLPGAWAGGMQELLGLDVPDHARGCLQDVHWSLGQWGYFPTYSLGNMHAAQLFEQARVDLPELDDHLAATGHAEPLVAWLDEHVYRFGRTGTSDEIVTDATGRAPDEDALVRHLERRFS